MVLQLLKNKFGIKGIEEKFEIDTGGTVQNFLNSTQQGIFESNTCSKSDLKEETPVEVITKDNISLNQSTLKGEKEKDGYENIKECDTNWNQVSGLNDGYYIYGLSRRTRRRRVFIWPKKKYCYLNGKMSYKGIPTRKKTGENRKKIKQLSIIDSKRNEFKDIVDQDMNDIKGDKVTSIKMHSSTERLYKYSKTYKQILSVFVLLLLIILFYLIFRK
jgi:hypothetical protein